MTTNDPQPDQPTPNEPVPPPPPPPPATEYAPPPPPPPPGGGAQPVTGLGQGLANPTVAGFPPARQQDETIWALLAHLSVFVLALIGPLIIMLVAAQERPFARAHAVEALNFHITLLIAMVISLFLIILLIGLITTPLLFIYGVVFGIIAAIAASKGEGYRYPLTLRMVN